MKCPVCGTSINEGSKTCFKHRPVGHRVIINGVEFDSIRAAADELKINRSTIRYRIRSVTDNWKKWRYADDQN